MHVVTGAGGFIGSNIVRTLNDRGITDILAVDDLTHGDKHRNLADCILADFLSPEDFLALLNTAQPPHFTAILHNGACADTMENDGRYMMERNFTYSKHVFQFAVRHAVPLVYASSASVYGIGRDATEEPRFERPVNMYAYSKLAFDQYVRANLRRVESTVVGLRYFNVYGEREAQKGRMASMVYQIARQLIQTGTVRLFEGTDGFEAGGQMRDFVHVRDVVAVNLHFAEQPAVQGILNVGTGRARSFNDAANLLIARLGGGRIEYVPFPDTLRGKYQSFTESNPERLRAAGYKESFLTLEEGIDATLPYWQETCAAMA